MLRCIYRGVVYEFWVGGRDLICLKRAWGHVILWFHKGTSGALSTVPLGSAMVLR